MVDLFATQAILPSLARHYTYRPRMGFAVNASTFGMAVSGLVVGFLAAFDRRFGILVSLALLSVPTALLATRRIWRSSPCSRRAGTVHGSGLYADAGLSRRDCSPRDAGGAFAAYITGNVASNLFGRLVSAAVADHLGLASNFYFFALLNLAGAVLVYFTIDASSRCMRCHRPNRRSGDHWPFARSGPALAFAVGFWILFAFIGTFTYVNFVLVRQPFRLADGARLCLFRLSAFRCLHAVRRQGGARLGTRPAIWGGLAVAPRTAAAVVRASAAVLAGLVLVGVGTFFAQAVATGFVSRAARADRGVASGIYLACYFLGGLVGSAVLGQLFDRFGWTACVAGIAASLAIAALLTTRLALKPSAASPA